MSDTSGSRDGVKLLEAFSNIIMKASYELRDPGIAREITEESTSKIYDVSLVGDGNGGW